MLALGKQAMQRNCTMQIPALPHCRDCSQLIKAVKEYVVMAGLQQHHNNIAVFNRVTIITKDWFCFALHVLCLLIGQKTCNIFSTNQIQILKPLATWSCVFSHPSGNLSIFSLGCHWLLSAFSFCLIGLCCNFGFGLKTFDLKAI